MNVAVLDNKKNTPPKLRYTLLELPRALHELSCLLPAHRWLKQRPKGSGQPVMVLPGFGASDNSTAIFRHYLKSWGYQALPWGHGANMDPRKINTFADVVTARDQILVEVIENLAKVNKETGQTVSLIGWSLGGILSRMIASQRPELIRQVITLGTPFGDPRSVAVYHIMERIHKHSIAENELEEWNAMCDAPLYKTPLSIIYSKSDGFVAPQIATKETTPFLENIQVCSSHVGFIVNPSVISLIADRLAQTEGAWQPYQYKGLGKLLYS